MKTSFLTKSCSKLVCIVIVAALVLTIQAHDQDDAKAIGNSAPPGVGGSGPWESANITLLAHKPLNEIGGGPGNVIGNDLWGWTDSSTGKEYVIYGLTHGTSFVDVSDPADPGYLGFLPTATGNAVWRDMKVFNDYAYIVSDGNGDHGLQIFDLTRLRSADPNNPQTFSEDGHHSSFGRAHNIAINEDSGYAYVVGSDRTSGGLRVLDLNQDPLNPTVAGNFGDDGYTHDAQAVNYIGPDSDYTGSEVVFAFNEDTLTIVDVTNKNNMQLISRNGYPDANYTHQGWASEDHTHVFINDELDEWNLGGPTRTHIFDIRDLDNPIYRGFYTGTQSTIDHNLYVKGCHIYQANYESGLRVLDMGDPANPQPTEIAFFDTFNTGNEVSFNGAWSVYPFFASGTLAVNDRQNGLFLLKLIPAIEFNDAQPVTGTIIAGNVNDLGCSDDSHLTTRSGFGNNFVDLHHMKMVVSAVANGEVLTLFDLSIESSISDESGLAQISLRNWNTGEFEIVGSHSIGDTDETQIFADLPSADYIDVGGEIEIAIKHIVFVPFFAHTFESYVDEIGIDFQDN